MALLRVRETKQRNLPTISECEPQLLEKVASQDERLRKAYNLHEKKWTHVEYHRN